MHLRRLLLTFPWTLIALAALLAPLTGCGGKRTRAQQDLDRADAALKTALDAWKKGEPAKKLASQSPSLVVSDPDWKPGTKLVSYEIKRAEGYEGDNVRCWVVLSLQGRQGPAQAKEVVYEVHLGDDRIAIGRDPFF